MLRSTPRLLALLLAASALNLSLAGCATMSNLSGTPKKDAEAKAATTTPKSVATDLDGNLRQARLLRQAGSYDDAIHILSQLMLAAADDPRVTAEYGKTLAQKGRANDATQFLRRAIELSPNDWTLYSALGVSYDQLNDPANARLAYDHALMLKPGEASVLNNYALSRMMAKDPQGARALIGQAQAAAGGVSDAKIMRNVALINDMAPDVAAANAPKPSAVASATKPAPKLPATVAAAPPPKLAMTAPPVVTKPMPAPLPAAPQAPRAADAAGAPQNAGDVARLLARQSPVADTANGAPRPLAPQLASAQVPAQPISQTPQNAGASGVVMQAVPYDPYAGPVLMLKKPKPRAVAKAGAPKTDTANAGKDEGAKPQKTAAAKPNVVPSLRIAADNY